MTTKAKLLIVIAVLAAMLAVSAGLGASDSFRTTSLLNSVAAARAACFRLGYSVGTLNAYRYMAHKKLHDETEDRRLCNAEVQDAPH